MTASAAAQPSMTRLHASSVAPRAGSANPPSSAFRCCTGCLPLPSPLCGPPPFTDDHAPGGAEQGRGTYVPVRTEVGPSHGCCGKSGTHTHEIPSPDAPRSQPQGECLRAIGDLRKNALHSRPQWTFVSRNAKCSTARRAYVPAVRMAMRLGAAARDARLAAGLKLLDIATRAGVAESTIHQFEDGVGWRRQTDEIVAAYARELGIEERALWLAALDDSRF